MATISFLKYDRVILVENPVEGTEVTCQELINAIRDYEDELSFMDYGHIANAYGKQPLGGGSFVGITLELINNWRIQFESPGAPPTITVYVRGGNLVAVNSYSNNPIKPSDYVTVIIAQSSSPTIITPPEDLNMLYLIESLRGRHATLGSIFYWDPVGGNDANDGTQPGDAVQTFAMAQTLCTAGNNDIIFALATDSLGITTVTNESLNITVPTLKLRGPGYAFQLKPATSGSDVINVTANAHGIEISGFYIEPAAGGSDNGITINDADNILIKDCWIYGATANGIDISNSTRTKIEKCAIENCSAGNGIALGAATTRNNISTCIITGCANGVDLSGSGLSDNILENNIIYNNTGAGIDISTDVARTGIRLHHTLSGNTPNINNLSSTTFQDTSGTITQGDIDAIVDGVWDEVISPAHVTVGTAGRTLRDAKTKATLASLK
ncbi:hypothetical protein A3A76_00170 [Candidatus Woesebacteria bacterium RIFCSPLOWO2_01_FULL_39_23]|uniref:Right handed beta helix domain-containing protein n=1 Tax=Candidatus Woesebacteria bacterium RIFCSPHIGHO2_01_FULL_40_22 TaxID=1802499 RepID=A0A1F7YG44_9BACT|nr:MAG: hypothetical protein A2141_02970 [Candidatus Woesebacteria bacterium RBG_16_40_11]OGM26297.1 MAG: hypothetical protein A2628_03790 [Candidatus Woesebacteria bacterium RIFCSPHIGHO2_01_FULL_40_22]OGM35996.1 MAG: hypothetical protein A3E41_01025 [Candidatus Woesebacteria bacterium RIFCSPHIGHO2_12_FULL_38_9]OGM62852.1 MAG: hypothetical protein A3A76_00170 [Candidatus Woesebacteria bacterium RIFCSPLOWO2_01_FULL_39_23]